MSSQQTLYIQPTKLEPDVQEKLNKLRSIGALIEVQLGELEKSGKILRKSLEMSIEARKEGNALYTSKKHDSQIHKAILIQYSKSIAFAPKDTEELALGYSNRSIFLMHIHHDEQSLVDIDRALKITKDDELKTKLEARKKKCLRLISKKIMEESAKNMNISSYKKDQEAFASKLKNFKASATLPCASDSVGLAYNNTFGRHLVATRDIKPGEILIIEQGYVCHPKQDQIYLVCSHCLQIAWNGIPCNDCVFAIYCSETCKNEAFTEYHDIECPVIKYVACTVPNLHCRMAAMRSLITAIKREGFEKIAEETSQVAEETGFESLLTNGMLHSCKFKSCYNLLNCAEHNGKDEEDDMFESIMVYFLIAHTDLLVMGNNHNTNVFIEPTLLLKCKDILTKLKYIIDFNGHLYTTSPFQCGCQNLNECQKTCDNERGVVIAPCCSLLNHSCTANVARESVPKRKFIVYSVSPIKKGEQLYDSYRVSIMTHDLEVRQSQLKLHFHFTCKCQACKKKIVIQKDSVLDEKNQKKILAEFQKFFPKAMNNSFFVDSIENWKFSEEVLQYVVRMSQLFYEHLGYYEAYKHNYRGKIYMEKLIIELYGEKCAILNHC